MESGKLAFLGLGVMGFPMAGHLARAGHSVVVYNRTPAKAAQWVEKYGGSSAPTPAAAAADAALVMMCVGNDDDVRAVALGADGAVAAMRDGSVLVDHTTASATVAREVHAAAKARGVGFLDAPVSGGQAGAENGKLTIMVGGEADVFARAEGVLAHYARAVTLMGGPGSGQLTKMVNQICIAGLVQALSEGINFAQQGRARRRARARRHRQRGGAILADGQSRQDDGRRQVRLRLCRRLDAQGSRDLLGRSAGQRRGAAGDCAGRPVLRAHSGAGRRTLGHVEPDSPVAGLRASAQAARR